MSKFGLWTSMKKEIPPTPVVDSGAYYLCLVSQNQVVPLRYVHRGASARTKDRYVWEYQGRAAIWDVLAWMPFPVVSDFIRDELVGGNNISAI